MVLGNLALMLGVHPYKFHEWHMAMYVDAVDWVSLPNALGMSQHGDGGIVGTKPYVSTGNYIHRMSNFCGTIASTITARPPATKPVPSQHCTGIFWTVTTTVQGEPPHGHADETCRFKAAKAGNRRDSQGCGSIEEEVASVTGPAMPSPRSQRTATRCNNKAQFGHPGLPRLPRGSYRGRLAPHEPSRTDSKNVCHVTTRTKHGDGCDSATPSGMGRLGGPLDDH